MPGVRRRSRSEYGEGARPDLSNRDEALLNVRCPRCKSQFINRSQRKAWERVLLPLLNAKACRCKDCNRRFWASDGGRFGVFVVAALFSLLFVSLIILGAFLMQQK